MAVVRKFEVANQGQQRAQPESIRGKIVPLELDGEKFLQIYSLGSRDREVKGQSSQNLRLSKHAFDQLVEIGRKHFD